ncbi:AbrB/MazE/SpoVT family DNA-binding domain-containing protein [Brucella sp. IR073]|uniref:AbrB/MazE/SpoVT family DNA-binding domain-containing protein n=1 Tax=unclassified Brucella TaxID=2632610 RepID=UPI003B987FE2
MSDTKRKVVGSAAGTGLLATAKLKKSGGSLVMTIPAVARNMLGLTEGQEMAVSVKGTQVIAEPMPEQNKTIKVRQPKYTLDELLEGYDRDAPLSEEEREWMDMSPVGREIW